MNYYPFHVGDYVSATRHLSWEEDAAYRRLLDTYYTTEKPLPTELRAVCRLVIAQTDGQREAVKVILEEFFELTPDGWRNGRADVEILAMREKQQVQRDKANKRWDKLRAERGNASAMPQHDKTDAAASKPDANAMPPTPTPTPTPNIKSTTSSGRPDRPPNGHRVEVEILGYLNAKTGRDYQPVKANIDLITARLKDGASPDDMRDVIDRKCAQWAGNDKMSGYLRPATLFNATKFAQYSGERDAPDSNHMPGRIPI